MKRIIYTAIREFLEPKTLVWHGAFVVVLGLFAWYFHHQLAPVIAIAAVYLSYSFAMNIFTAQQGMEKPTPWRKVQAAKTRPARMVSNLFFALYIALSIRLLTDQYGSLVSLAAIILIFFAMMFSIDEWKAGKQRSFTANSSRDGRQGL